MLDPGGQDQEHKDDTSSSSSDDSSGQEMERDLRKNQMNRRSFRKSMTAEPVIPEPVVKTATPPLTSDPRRKSMLTMMLEERIKAELGES